MATDEEIVERIRRAPSPRIRRQLAAAGIDAAAFDLAMLSSLPPLDPADLDLDRLDDPVGELRLADAPSPVRLGVSERSGASIVLSWTARDLERAARGGARLLGVAGVRAGMKIANTLDGGFTTPGSLGFGDAAEALGALDIPLGPVRDEKAARAAGDLLARVGVDVVALDARTGAALLAELRQRRPDTLAGILWLGTEEVPTGVAPWVRRWVSIPEAAPFSAMECEASSLHLAAELQGEIVNGRLAVSSLGADAPVLRLDSGIAAEITAEPCRCGTPGPRLLPR